MAIREIRLENVRSYELFSAELNPGVTLILGRNGTGKTTLLEGLYYLAQGTSFRGRDRDMIAHNSTRANLMTIDDDENKRRASLQLTSDEKVKKTFATQDKTTTRLPAKSRQPVVLFEPDELRLLSSSPDRRRKFFDGVLARLYPQYGTVLARYQRTLLQRNELLKQYAQVSSGKTSREASFRGRSAVPGLAPGTSGGGMPLLRDIEDHLFTWDIKFAELASVVTDMRRNFITTSNTHLSRLYSSVAMTDHHVNVAYTSRIPAENYRQKLLDQLHKDQVGDSYRGYTTSGPHRDDFSLFLDSHLASETASRGEMRTIMLAYKLLEVELQHEIYDAPPLILMDDVFSELDATREQQLMAKLSPYQTIITATDLRDELKINASIVGL